jgi:hypothetical protein
MVSEEINAIKRKPVDKISGHLRNWPDSTHHSLNGMKRVNLLERPLFGKRMAMGHPAQTGVPRKLFDQESIHHAQSPWHSETKVIVLQGYQATAGNGNRPWCNPHDVGLAGY